jgi:ankyrin repeat protein
MLKTRLGHTGRRLGMLATCFSAVGMAAGVHARSDTPVADAVMRGDSSQLRVLIQQGVDVNTAQADGMTALHWAASRGDTSAVRMLVAAGARIEVHTRNGSYTPLHMAAREGRATAAKVLLASGANVNAPLHFASSNGDSATVDALLDKGAAINARDSANAQTPLMWAAAADRVFAVTTLIKHGADLEVTSRVEDIPLVEKADRAAAAARTRRIAALKSAEEAPVISAGSPRAGTTVGAAGSAVAMPPSAAPVTPALPAAGAASPNANVIEPKTAEAAPKGGRGGEAGKLEVPVPREGRGPSYTDLIGMKGGLTALLFAARDGHIDVVRALIAGGAKVNHVSAGDHSSPILLATINGNFDLAKLLLESGADVKLASDANNTPLYAAINVQWSPKTGYPAPVAQGQQNTAYLELMELLLKAGADPNVRLTKHLWYMSYNFDQLGVNTAGATPFWRAAYGTDVAAMKLLVRYGADVNIPTLKPSGALPGSDTPDEAAANSQDLSGLPPVPDGGPGTYPIHAASGVGFSEGFAGNAHRHAPDGWLPSLKYLIEEQHADVNARDFNGYTALHHAATRGDNEVIKYLISKGADLTVVSRRGQTATDMANGPVQRVPPFFDTIALLEGLGVKNNHKCKSC